jgi:tRNA 2-thiouridine synthesizing protein D
MTKKTLAIALMDPPYESENLTTAFRILDVAVRRGYDVNVFAYEGAAGLAFVRQAAHPNPVHGKDVAEENHPTTKDQVAALVAAAGKN